MDKFIIFALFCILIFSFFGCSDSDPDNKGSIITPMLLLPADNDISGWVSFGSYEEANDYDSLYDVIGIDAQIYIDNGFLSGVFQQYIDSVGKGTVYIRIYDQGNEANASMTYSKVATGIGIPWGGAGREARIDKTLVASYMIEFWQKNFFIQVIIDEKTDEALNIAKQFASYISKRIG